MDFKEALSHLEKGEKIRRKAWEEKKCCDSSKSLFLTFTHDDVKAEDWEVVEGEKCDAKTITISKDAYRIIVVAKITALVANKTISMREAHKLTIAAALIGKMLFGEDEIEKEEDENGKRN